MLDDTGKIKHCRLKIAAASHPLQKIEEEKKGLQLDKKRSTPQIIQSRKHRKQPFYVNWHSPFLLEKIDAAAKEAGLRMSAERIQSILALRYPWNFTIIAQSTIENWINRSTNKNKPQWTTAALCMAEKGYHQGGHRGHIGVLVHCSWNQRNNV